MTGNGGPGKRHRLLEPIGSGSMGIVFCAYDRLTGETVALKRVLARPESWQFPSGSSSTEPHLLLAREFEALASLHHPNVIAVRDYGFDTAGQPYFTMEFLPDAQTILEAGAGQPQAVKVDLVVQMLRALAYLHRRGIIHRDLKPTNVLVCDERVKVLDFGLALGAGQQGQASGTLAYMAPEVLDRAPAGIAADLYAAGMLAYELLAEAYPFRRDDLSGLVDAILDEMPDFDRPGTPPELVPVLSRLLAKEPQARYRSADAVIQALGEAVGQPLPPETAETRESFLQAARFVGREAEVAQLTGALQAAQAGQGSAWLVGGESGVGKSRLLQEVRTRAMVAGAEVLTGQAIDGGGSPYQLWRNIARWLAILAEPGDLQAGVLKGLVPQVGQLLGREVPDAPDLEPDAARTRLMTVLAELLQRCTASGPLVLLLEDLQWAGANSLALVQWINRLALDLPLLIVSTYRDDERRDLPDNLPDMRLLHLPRLAKADVAALSVSMLGAAGRQPSVVDFLQTETEGNAFFLVEVVRALAEEAGQLAKIGQVPLPARGLTGGMEQVIQRRLNRVPETAIPLLQLAAVAGREIDVALLAAAAPGQEIEPWLIGCANVAVLALQDGVWRFSHDKLREGMLRRLDPVQKRALHRQVGAAIEQAYASDLPLYAADLAHHYAQAGATERERHYARLAGEQAAAQFENENALAYLGRALELTPAAALDERFALLLAREAVHGLQGQRQAQVQDLEALQRLIEALAAGEPTTDRQPQLACWQAELALRRADYARVTADYATAISQARQALDLARAVRPPAPEARHMEAKGHLLWGQALTRLGDNDGALAQLQQALALAQTHHLDQVAATALRNLGIALYNQSDHAAAQSHYCQALDLCREIGHRPGEAGSLNNLGLTFADQGDFDKARPYYQEALGLFQEIGERLGEAVVRNNLGIVHRNQGAYAQARTCYEANLRLAQKLGNRRGESVALNNLGIVAENQGHYGEALTLFEQALEISREVGNRRSEASVLSHLGSLFASCGDETEARACYAQSLRLSREIGYRQIEGAALAGLGYLWIQQGDLQRGLDHCQQAIGIAGEIGDRANQAQALAILGLARRGQRHYAESISAYDRARRLRRELGHDSLAVEALANQAQAKLLQGDLDQARSAVEEVVAHLQGHGPAGLSNPVSVYLACYHVLRAGGEARAYELLETGAKLLHSAAAQFDDQEMQHAYLSKVPAHRELDAEWRAVTASRD